MKCIHLHIGFSIYCAYQWSLVFSVALLYPPSWHLCETPRQAFFKQTSLSFLATSDTKYIQYTKYQLTRYIAFFHSLSN